MTAIIARRVAPLLALTALVGCQQTGEPITSNGSEPLAVVTTTGMIADAVGRVGGPFVKAEALMGPGVDPHRYVPSAGDIGRLNRAKVVFFNGLHLEGKMTDALERGRRPAKAVTAALDPAKELRAADGGDGAHDPHVWFDVKLWAKCVEVVRDTLTEQDPSHAADYKANAATYLAELAALDAEVRAKIGALPADRRVMVTGHDAFRYFGAAYGLEVHGLQGVSTAAETTTRDVQELAQFLGTRRVPAVFGETSVPPKGLRAVLDAVREKYGFEVRLIGGDDALYSDALGDAGTPAGTYVGMVRHNVNVIVGALSK
jgi:manganese/zinc/iron transport system substrate-binding protein